MNPNPPHATATIDTVAHAFARVSLWPRDRVRRACISLPTADLQIALKSAPYRIRRNYLNALGKGLATDLQDKLRHVPPPSPQAAHESRLAVLQAIRQSQHMPPA